MRGRRGRGGGVGEEREGRRGEREEGRGGGGEREGEGWGRREWGRRERMGGVGEERGGEGWGRREEGRGGGGERGGEGWGRREMMGGGRRERMGEEGYTDWHTEHAKCAHTHSHNPIPAHTHTQPPTPLYAHTPAHSRLPCARVWLLCFHSRGSLPHRTAAELGGPGHSPHSMLSWPSLPLTLGVSCPATPSRGSPSVLQLRAEWSGVE